MNGGVVLVAVGLVVLIIGLVTMFANGKPGKRSTASRRASMVKSTRQRAMIK